MAKVYSKSELRKKANEILKIAEQCGVEQNYFFVTTFKKYQTQLKILDELEKEINNGETLISKEYVKNRKNVYINPAIKEYNNTCSASNNTIVTLLKIIETLKDNGLNEVTDDGNPFA